MEREGKTLCYAGKSLVFFIQAEGFLSCVLTVVILADLHISL